MKKLFTRYLWIGLLILIGLFYMGLVALGVGVVVDAAIAHGLGSPWIGLIKAAGYIGAFLSLLYPMYFARLIEVAVLRHGPLFTKGPRLFGFRSETQTSEPDPDLTTAEQDAPSNGGQPSSLNSRFHPRRG